MKICNKEKQIETNQSHRILIAPPDKPIERMFTYSVESLENKSR